MDLDLAAFNGDTFLVARPITLQFVVGANSFLPILVFNDQLRGLEPGSMTLIPAGVNDPGYSYNLPASLASSLKQLVVEKLPSGQGFDLAVRDSNTGFTFFNVDGHQYGYDSAAQSLAITNGRLLVSKEFANALGRPSDAGAVIGTISIGATMQPIQIDQLVNGETKSMVMPPMQHTISPDTPAALVHGPDVIVGQVEDVAQMGHVGTQFNFAVGTDSCNNGDVPVDWFALPNTDHPVVPQNLYRMSGGTDGKERFEQIGQSWVKHTFFALEDSVCGTCMTAGCSTGDHLCPGCSDPYVSGLNGDQNSIGSRAWINPFTGVFPTNADDHTGHVHNPVSHRILVNASDLISGVSYFGEAAYITPHEYSWCQTHPDQCNMFNNFSYRPFSISGGPNTFTFTPTAQTVRMQPAIIAWRTLASASVSPVEPDPGNDGVWYMGYKVTNPSAGVWHYEYALFNMNLDRAIQSFSVPVGPGVNISNVDFHAPPQHPGWAHDGTQGDAGYSSTPWDVTQDASSITWNTETFATNQNANAIRWGTLYNFRFDADQGPNSTNATVGFFKTGSPMSVTIQAPGGVPSPTPTPTATATPTATPTATATATPTSTPTVPPTATPTSTPTVPPTATPSPTPTPNPTSTPTVTPTVTPTPTGSPTATPRPTPTPRPNRSPRTRPTPHPRP
jgi:hypothetical protein